MVLDVIGQQSASIRLRIGHGFIRRVRTIRTIELNGGFSTRWATVMLRSQLRADLRRNACNCAQVLVSSVHSCKHLSDIHLYEPKLSDARADLMLTLLLQLKRAEREIAHQQKIPCQTCESVGVTDRPF